MSIKNSFLIKTLFFLWATVCVVIAEHQKRDVHRIILQERAPRSHNSMGLGRQNHGRKKGHARKKVKNGSEESKSSSSEESGSNETNFKDFFHSHKYHKPSFNRHRYPTNADIEEDRHHSFREEVHPFYNGEWMPSSAERHTHQRKEKDGRNKRKSKMNAPRIVQQPYVNPFAVLETSHRPFEHAIDNQEFSNLGKSLAPTFETSTLYPPINVMSTFSDLNKHLLNANPPTASAAEQDSEKEKDDSDRLKNHQNVYEVLESQASNLDGFIFVPEKSEISSVEFNHPVKFRSKVNPRIRGHIKFNSKV